jgi:hypothetical protein
LNDVEIDLVSLIVTLLILFIPQFLQLWFTVKFVSGENVRQFLSFVVVEVSRTPPFWFSRRRILRRTNPFIRFAYLLQELRVRFLGFQMFRINAERGAAGTRDRHIFWNGAIF